MSKNVISMGFFFGAVTYAVCVFFVPFEFALGLGVVAAVFYSAAISIVLKLDSRKYADDEKQITQEILLRESANYDTENKLRNGFLYLTQDRLIYISREKKDVLRIEIPLDTITAVSYCKVFKHIKGLKIVLNDETEKVFAFANAPKYVKRIDEMIKY